MNWVGGWRRLLCNLGRCPRERAGWYCDGSEGRCGWDAP